MNKRLFNIVMNEEGEGGGAAPATPEVKNFDPKPFITEGYSTAMNLVDETLRNLGIEKKQGEKTTVALERAIKGLKESQVAVDADAQGLINALKKENARYQKEIEGMKEATTVQMLKADLKALPFDENYRDVTEKFLISELKNYKPEIRDGRFIYKNDDGAVEYDPTTGAPHTTESLIKSKYAKYLKESKEQQKGSGANVDGESSPKPVGKFNFDPSKIRTKSELISHLSEELKMKVASTEFTEAYKEGISSLNLTK